MLPRRNASVSWLNMSKQKREQASQRPADVCDGRKNTPAAGLLRQNLSYRCSATVCTNWFIYSSWQTERLISCSDAGYCQVTSCSASCTTTQTNWGVDHKTRLTCVSCGKDAVFFVCGERQRTFCANRSVLRVFALYAAVSDLVYIPGWQSGRFVFLRQWRTRLNEARNHVFFVWKLVNVTPIVTRVFIWSLTQCCFLFNVCLILPAWKGTWSKRFSSAATLFRGNWLNWCFS